MYKLQEQKINEPNELSCSFYSVALDNTDCIEILVVSVSGIYPRGKLGNEHGIYISAKTIEGLIAFNPHCVILDFRELQFESGDLLRKVIIDISEFKHSRLKSGESGFPVLFVTSSSNEASIMSVFNPSGGERMKELMYQNIDEAISGGVILANEYLG